MSTGHAISVTRGVFTTAVVPKTKDQSRGRQITSEAQFSSSKVNVEIPPLRGTYSQKGLSTIYFPALIGTFTKQRQVLALHISDLLSNGVLLLN